MRRKGWSWFCFSCWKFITTEGGRLPRPSQADWFWYKNQLKRSSCAQRKGWRCGVRLHHGTTQRRGKYAGWSQKTQPIKLGLRKRPNSRRTIQLSMFVVKLICCYGGEDKASNEICVCKNNQIKMRVNGQGTVLQTSVLWCPSVSSPPSLPKGFRSRVKSSLPLLVREEEFLYF